MQVTNFPFLYGITDSTLMPEQQFSQKAEAALNAGLKLLQYRDKSNDHNKRSRQAQLLRELCNKYRSQLIVNDDIDLAKEIKADGVHLGQLDGSIAAARKILGNNAIIGATCHNDIELAKTALKEGASYVAFGRFFSSQTKRNAPPAELSLLTTARETLNCPIVAIGGINTHNAATAWRAGAHSVAVCHDIFATENQNENINLFINKYQSTL